MNCQLRQRFTYHLILLLTFVGTSVLTANGENMEFWGAQTNNLRGGLWFRTGSDAASFGIIPELGYGSNTNNPSDMMFLYLPPEKSRYRMALFDEKGKLIAKTSAGKALPEPIQPERYGVDSQHGYVLFGLTRGYNEPIASAPIILRDYFNFTNSGHYFLRLQIGVVWRTPQMKSNDVPKLIYLPPIDAEFDIKLK